MANFIVSYVAENKERTSITIKRTIKADDAEEAAKIFFESVAYELADYRNEATVQVAHENNPDKQRDVHVEIEWEATIATAFLDEEE